MAKFEKGRTPHNKGKSLVEIYGEEKAEEIRAKLVMARQDNRKAPRHEGRSRAVVAVNSAGRFCVFPSVSECSRRLHVDRPTVRRICDHRKGNRTTHGLRFFWEASTEWEPLVK